MKQKEVIIAKNNSQSISTTRNKWFDVLLRFLIIANFASMFTIVLFHLPPKIVDVENAIHNSLRIFMMILLLMMCYVTMRIYSKITHGWFVNFIVIVSIGVGYSWFMTIYLKDIQIEKWRELFKVWYFLWPVLAYSIVGNAWVSFRERKTSPFLSTKIILRVINGMLLMLTLWIGYLFVLWNSNLLSNQETIYFAYSFGDNIQTIHLMAIALMLMLYVSLEIAIWINFRNRIKNSDSVRNASLAVIITIVTSLGIWFIFKYNLLPQNWEDYVLVVIDFMVLATIIGIIIAKKKALLSNAIFSVIISLALIIVWGSKFMLEIVSDDISTDWSIVVSMVSFTIITLIMLFVNDPLSKKQSISLMMFAITLFLYIMVQWLMRGWPLLKENSAFIETFIGFNIETGLSTFVLSGLVVMVSLSVMAWYRIQSKINRRISKRIRKGGFDE